MRQERPQLASTVSPRCGEWFSLSETRISASDGPSRTRVAIGDGELMPLMGNPMAWSPRLRADPAGSSGGFSARLHRTAARFPRFAFRSGNAHGSEFVRHRPTERSSAREMAPGRTTTRYKPKILRQTTSDAPERPREVCGTCHGFAGKPMLEAELETLQRISRWSGRTSSAVGQMRPQQVLGQRRDKGVRDSRKDPMRAKNDGFRQRPGTDSRPRRQAGTHRLRTRAVQMQTSVTKGRNDDLLGAIQDSQLNKRLALLQMPELMFSSVTVPSSTRIPTASASPPRSSTH